jgi:hypothetical protein
VKLKGLADECLVGPDVRFELMGFDYKRCCLH